MMTFTNFGIEMGPAADVHSAVRKRAAANTCTPPPMLSLRRPAPMLSPKTARGLVAIKVHTSSFVAVSLFEATL